MFSTFFLKDEPLNNYLKLSPVGLDELEKWSLKSISDNCSFKAVTPTGEIVGAFISGIVEKSVSENYIFFLFHI